MININLLPIKEREKIAWDTWRRLILVLGIAILSGLVIVSIVLVGTSFYLSQNLTKTALLLNLQRQFPSSLEINLIENKLATVDKRIKQISEIRSKISVKAFIFTELASMLPENVRLSSFLLKSDNSVELKGVAGQRLALLAFKKALENNTKISNLNFPLANLLKEKDIEFSLSFKIGGIKK